MAAGSIVVDLLMKTGSFETDTKRAEKRTKEMAAQIDKAFNIVAVGAAAVGGAFLAMTNQVLQTADSAAKSARSIGITTESLTSLQYAAEMSGVSSDEFNQSLIKLNKAAADGNKAFAAMGVSVKDSNGTIKSTDALLKEVSDKFAGYKDGAEKSALAQELFGKSGANMISFLNSGSQGLSDMQKEAEQLGIVIGGELAANAEIFNDNLSRIQKSVMGLVVEIAGPLIAALAKMTTEFLKAAQAGDTLAGSIARALSGGVVGDRSDIQGAAKDVETFTAKLKALDRQVAQYGNQEIPLELSFQRDATSADLAASMKNYNQLAARLVAPAPVAPSASAPLMQQQKSLEDAAKLKKKSEEDHAAWLRPFTEAEEKNRMQLFQNRLQAEEDLKKKQAERLAELTGAAELEKQREDMLLLADAFETGKISAETYGEAVRNALGLGKEEGGYWERWLMAAQDAMMSFNDLASAVISSFTSRMGDAFEKMVFDGQSLKESFKSLAESMARSVINALGQMAAQWLAYQAVQLLVGKTTQASSSAAKTFEAMAAQQMAAIHAFSSTAAIPVVGPPAAPAAAVAALAATAPMVATIASLNAAAVGARATGGPVSADAPYLVGERGPELFVPNTAGRIIPNNAMGNDSGVVVQQTINVTTGIQQTVRAEIMSLMPQIANAAKSAVADARMRGGSYATAMR